jgi:hypothetical protein
MNAKDEASKLLDQAFRAALLLTGRAEDAESAVLDGIAALEPGNIADDVFLIETAKSAIQRRANRPSQVEQRFSFSPFESRWRISSDPIFRECSVLRVVSGITSGILHLTIQETEEMPREACTES